MSNRLYYGDNLDILRTKIKDDSIDLCYIDPPFNSKRDYFQIYSNIGKEDRAQAQAFIDTWEWGDEANIRYQEIITNPEGRFTSQTVDLIKGLNIVLKKGSLLAYLVSMTLRIAEIQRVLKPTGSFYLHCDPTASHYLKLIIDAVLIPNGGDFRNEIVWGYRTGGISKQWFARKHDIIFLYSKSKSPVFNLQHYLSPQKHKYGFGKKHGYDLVEIDGNYYKNAFCRDVWDDLDAIGTMGRPGEVRLGYPTQKPEALLERIINASSNEGDLVLDAYCGCGTTVAVAQRLNRAWIGIDITYQSISLILKRFEDTFGKDVVATIILDGIPQDMDSAIALANKRDDRLRKEFEKWSILTYTNNRGVINTKKGADGGIDGIAYFGEDSETTGKVIFQSKSGVVNRGTIATLRGDMEREQAQIGILITLNEPTEPMIAEAASAGMYYHKLMGRSYPRIQIVTIRQMLEDNARLELPLSFEVLKSAQSKTTVNQMGLSLE